MLDKYFGLWETLIFFLLTHSQTHFQMSFCISLDEQKPVKCKVYPSLAQCIDVYDNLRCKKK